MASKPLSEIKRFLSKLNKNLKRKKAATNPQNKTEVVSASEPVSKAPATTSSAPASTSTANIPEAAAVILPETPKKIVETSLWSRAYDNLREKDEKLVEVYKQLLSRELQTSTAPNNDLPAAGRDNGDESYAQGENQIENSDRRMRLTQLETIASNGLQQLDKKRAKYNIFGHEFILRNQIAQATRFIHTIKDAIDEAVKISPEASLAWAGVCVILPILMNPGAAEEASRDGCLYVTSRIRFYVKLESLLLASIQLQDSGIHVELENRLIALYQLIIDFQIRIVRRVYLTRLERLKEDTVRHEDWKGMIARIQESEKLFSNDFKLIRDVPLKEALEELNSNAEKLATVIDSMLTFLLKDSRKASALSFQNEGSGNQFNTTGGTQYNATGKGMQFSGTIFSAPVHFNRNEG